jgi:glucose-6-phosphate 1-dehydrogenase
MIERLDNFVIFGASGDLAKGYIFPALNNLFPQIKFNYYGYGRTQMSQGEFRKVVSEVSENPEFTKRFEYVSGEYSKDGFLKLKKNLKGTDSIFYLAIPTQYDLVKNIVDNLVASGIFSSHSKIIIEKPFGSDYKSAKKLINLLKSSIGVKRVYLVDHYLTKELVKNIISLRFANPILNHLWNNGYIQKICINATETEGIDGRGQYYDQSGVIRDMVQNHCLQLLTLVTIDQPRRITQRSFARAKVHVLRKLRFYKDDMQKYLDIGQYRGYKQEKYINPDSCTETFTRMTLEVNTPFWESVPIVVTTGKKMENKSTEIKIYFKNDTKNCLWGEECARLYPNELIIDISGNKIELQINSHFNPSKTLPQPSKLRLGFADFNQTFHSAYENVILDVYQGNKINMPTFKEVLAQWRFVDKIEKVKDRLELKVY